MVMSDIAVPTKEPQRREKTGRVVSNKMMKTVVVEVEMTKAHPLYKRVMRRHKKFKAHDEFNRCEIGDLVRIRECRPLSKDKHFRVVEILGKSKTGAPAKEIEATVDASTINEVIEMSTPVTGTETGSSQE